MDSRFYQLPKYLFENERFKGLSIEAKVLFSIMHDRMELSKKNGWVDGNGRVYIYFTIKEAMDIIGISKSKCIKLFAELDDEKGCGLIRKRRQGQGKPSVIYIIDFSSDSCKKEESEEDLLKPVQKTSKSPETEPHEVSDKHSNNTNINKTDFSDTDSIFPSFDGDTIPKHTKRMLIKESLKSGIDYNVLISKYNEDMLSEIVEIMTDAVCSENDYFVIGRSRVDAKVVKERILSLKADHIEYVFDRIKENRPNIKNIKSYLLTSLFNSLSTINWYYETKVNSDLSV